MLSLPPELINTIGTNILKITDKRQFTQTCKICNNLIKPIILYQETTLKLKFPKIQNKDLTFKKHHFEYSTNYCMEKFTLELCYDEYFCKIPKHYLTPKNGISVKEYLVYALMKSFDASLLNTKIIDQIIT